MRNLFLLTLILSGYFTLAQTSPQRDLQFGTGGCSFVNLCDSLTRLDLTDMDVDVQGNVYTIGVRTLSTSSYIDKDYVIIKTAPNGKLDSSFYEKGYRQLGFGALYLPLTWQQPYHEPAFVKATSDAARVLVISGDYGTLKACRFKADGSIDSSFGTNGYSAVNFPSGMFDLIMLPDDRFIVLSTLNSGNGLYSILGTRFNAVGSVDNSYGVNGQMSIPFNNTISSNLFLRQAALYNDGSLLITATHQTINTFLYDSLVLCRVSASGMLDSAFGVNGYAKNYLSNNAAGMDLTIKTTVLPDSAILVLQANQRSPNEIVQFKFTKTGLRDDSFAPQGRKYNNLLGRDFTSFYDRFTDPFDLRIWMGKKTGALGSPAKIIRYQLKPDGNMDSSSVQDVAFNDLVSGSDYGDRHTLITGGRFFFHSGFPGTPQTNCVRADLKLDTSYLLNGTAPVAIKASTEQLISIQPLSNGKMVGLATNMAKTYLFGLTDKGFADSSFGVNGVVDMDTSYDSDHLLIGSGQLLVDKNDRFLTFFFRTDISGTDPWIYLLDRFKPNGTRDLSFGLNGRTFITYRAPEDFFLYRHAVIQSDNKILVLYETSLPSPRNRDIGILRLKEDGTPDSSFGTNGRRTIDFKLDFETGPFFFSSEDLADNFIQLKDSSILIVGRYASGHYIFKLDQFGQIIRTFGTNGRKTFEGNEDIYTFFLGETDAGQVIAAQNNQQHTTISVYSVSPDLQSSFMHSYVTSAATNAYFANGHIQHNGDVIFSGIEQKGTISKLVLMGIHASGGLNSSFGNNGLLYFNDVLPDTLTNTNPYYFFPSYTRAICFRDKNGELITATTAQRNRLGDIFLVKHLISDTLVSGLPANPVITASPSATVCDSHAYSQLSGMQWLYLFMEYGNRPHHQCERIWCICGNCYKCTRLC